MSAVLSPAWIAVDWGTSHLRAWLMDSAGQVLEQRTSDQGMGSLTPEGFGPALEALLTDIEGPLTVVCCGMVGSRQGWAEAPYTAVPCAPPSAKEATQVSHGRLQVFILPGIKQTTPADVMRGEETQIAGFLAEEPNFDGILCFPGTHTKWAHISAGEMVSFRTFMSGELFALLSKQSVLRHSIAPEGWDDAAFQDALSDALSRPADIAARLFGLRAEGLVGELPREEARARLSGYLIGMELAGAKPYWLGQPIAIIGAASLAKAYETALQAQGAMVRRIEAEGTTLAGLRAAYSTMKGSLA